MSFSEPGHYEVGNGLRKEKNLTLVMNTLSSRAAEEGEKTAYSMGYVGGVEAKAASELSLQMRFLTVK